jgi:hypothetical protein
MEKPGVFKTEEEANACLCAYLVEAIDNKVENVSEEKIKEFHHEEYFQHYDDGEQWCLKKEYHNNLDALKLIEAAWNYGEYIPWAWGWTHDAYDL